ncbi:hypothetical protein BD626DRAFT_508664 [Schizophyllum amplum]|uniref:Tubby C-terminal-like domain-containing protein n=1 Tax=Schizophyllum amplum TaxID=97359 RepID=A0A550C359_9AGAR|nr:hypothetical protein BD626DRAFT_508664 [Auriculariopsis ampla]
MQIFTFSDGKDILNGALISAGSQCDVAYTLGTTRNGRVRGVTSLSGTPTSSIIWPERYFDIGGETSRIDSVEREVWIEGRLTSARAWQWGQAEYELRYANGERTAKDLLSASANNVVASLRSPRSHVFHKNEPAQWSIEIPMLPTQLRFLLLALLYSEVRRLDVMGAGGGPPETAPGGV